MIDDNYIENIQRDRWEYLDQKNIQRDQWEYLDQKYNKVEFFERIKC